VGLKIKKATSKRIFSVAKREQTRPVSILSLLKVIDLLVDGTAKIAKAVNDNKAMQCQLEALNTIVS